MKKFLFIAIVLIGSSVGVFSKSINNDFNIPTIVQNYPTDHLLNMDNAEYAYEAINKLISSAVKSIDIEVFYIENKPDSKLDTYIIKPIISKAKSGIPVRIIVDSGMAKTYPETVDELNNVPNIEVVKNDYFKKKLDGIVHAKIIIVDNEIFYLGSHNLDWITFELNHELGIIFKNRNLAGTIKKVFEIDWKNDINTKAEDPVNVKIDSKEKYEIVISPPDIEDICPDEDSLIKLMNNAKNEICMQAMQVMGIGYGGTPVWTKFNEAILNAADRGVKVKIMFSNWEFTYSYIKWSNQFLQDLINNDKNNNIEIRYSVFPIHDPCVPYSEVDHAKYMIFDGASVWVSTANLTESYFTNCRNFSFIARNDIKLGKQLKKIFNTMWNSSYINIYASEVTEITDNTCKYSNSK